MEKSGSVDLFRTAPVQCYVPIPFPGCSFESGLKHNFLDKCPDTGTSATIDFHQPASASPAYSTPLHHQHFPPNLRSHHFFANAAFNAHRPPTMCFSCRGSSSSCLSCFALLTSTLPPLLFQR